MNLPFSSNLVSYHFFFKYMYDAMCWMSVILSTASDSDCVASTWTDVHLQWHSAPPSAAPSWAPTFVFFYSRPEPYMTTPTPWRFEKLTGQCTSDHDFADYVIQIPRDVLCVQRIRSSGYHISNCTMEMTPQRQSNQRITVVLGSLLRQRCCAAVEKASCF